MLMEYCANIKKIEIRSEEDLKICYEAIFLFACIWAIGGAVGGGGG